MPSSGRRVLRLAVVLTLIRAVASMPTAAQASCGQFSWSIGETIDLFDGFVPMFRNEQALPKDGVYAVELLPGTAVLYPVDPDRSRREGYGAIVTIENVASGRYRLALTEEARLDAVQDNALLPTVSIPLDPDCPRIKASLEVTAHDGPLTLQISGARQKLVRMGVSRIWAFE